MHTLCQTQRSPTVTPLPSTTIISMTEFYGTITNMNNKPLHVIGETLAQWAHDLWDDDCVTTSPLDTFTTVESDSTRMELSKNGNNDVTLYIFTADHDGCDMFHKFAISAYYGGVNVTYPRNISGRELLKIYDKTRVLTKK